MKSSGATIIPVAGGKGGVGKSILSANLAISLAGQGKKTIVVDLDLGGSNLHSYLGLPNDFPGIGDFLMSKEGALGDYQAGTDFANLTYIPGDGRTPFMANLTYGHKMKLARQITQLDADYVILDIGAGTSFNTIDYFGLSQRGILMATPDIPSLMNMLAFLKNFLLRNIIARIKKLPHTEALINDIRRQTIDSTHFTIEMLRDRLEHLNPEAAKKVDYVLKHYQPRVVLNLADEADDLHIASKVSGAASKQLSLPIDWFGFLYHDSSVRRSVRTRSIVMREYQQSRIAQGVDGLSKKIINEWHRTNDDRSLHSLMDEALLFEKRFAASETDS